MKQLIFCFGLIVAILTGHGHATQTPDQGKRADEIMAKFRQIDLLNQLIPLAMTKEQINKMLPAVERARARVRQTQKDEVAALEKEDSKVTEAIKHCVEKGVPPSKDLLMELAQTTARLSDVRMLVASENTEAVMKVFRDTMNAGQLKAASNSLKPELFDPSLKSDKMTDDEKIRFFVREIFLDPQAYDIMVKLAK